MENIPAYVISLEHQTKKYDRLKKDFSEKGIFVKKFSGVYGKDLDKDYIKEILHPYSMYTLKDGSTSAPEFHTLGAVGCALSHIKIWQHLLSSEEEVIHVLEDDAVMADTVENINDYIRSVPEDWDVIYLGFHRHYLFPRSDISISSNVYKINTHTFQTHSYIINKKGARKLLSKAFPIIHHIDAYMSFMAMEGGVNSYRPKKPLIKQGYGYYDSQVGTGLLSMSCLRSNISCIPSPIILLCVIVTLVFAVSAVKKFLFKKGF